MGVATVRCFENQCESYDSIDLDQKNVRLTAWLDELRQDGWVIDVPEDLFGALHGGPDTETLGQCPIHAVMQGD